jgi:hypothetical protein
MIASFMGLLLTTINSGWFFKGSKKLVEANKNAFYTFIQTELLPVINQSLASTFNSLQRNLLKFNDEFTGNIQQLSGAFGSNIEALNLQQRILASLEKADIKSIAEYNVTVLRELQISTKEFEKFNVYLFNINSFVENSTILANRLRGILDRTESLENIAASLENKLSQSQALLDFLSRHFQTLEEYRQKTTESIAETSFSISDVFKELEDQIKKLSKDFKDFTVEEVDLLKKTLEDSKPDLGNLQFLETINTDVALFKDSTASQGERIKALLQEQNSKIDLSLSTLNSIERLTVSLQRQSLKDYLKGFFTQNGE